MTVDEVERRLIFLTLEKTENNKTRAAKMLGVSLKTLHNKLRRYKDAGLLGTSDNGAEAPAIALSEAVLPEDGA
jgi:transposase